MTRRGGVETGVVLAYDAFVAAHRAGLVRLAYVICGDAYLAEDLVQSALVKAYRFWDKVAAADSPHAYVRQIVVREHLSWRRLRSSREISHPEPGNLDPTAATTDPDSSELEAAWAMLAGLPPKQRTVLALRYFDDLSDDDIATAMGVSAVTVRTNASRGLATLRERLTSEGQS